jgi:predicted nucleic acid-binding protein
MTRTPPLIHIDANVPIYAAGREHPLKAPCQELVRLAAAAP